MKDIRSILLNAGVGILAVVLLMGCQSTEQVDRVQWETVDLNVEVESVSAYPLLVSVWAHDLCGFQYQGSFLDDDTLITAWVVEATIKGGVYDGRIVVFLLPEDLLEQDLSKKGWTHEGKGLLVRACYSGGGTIPWENVKEVNAKR